MKHYAVLALIVILCSCAVQPQVQIQTQSGQHTFVIDKAQTLLERQKGLMGVTDLPQNKGMLFIFGDEQPRSFWMKDTLIPLDMIFINGQGQIAHIIHNAEPQGLKEGLADQDHIIYSSQKPAQYVLEINGGLAESLGMREGDSIFIPQ